MSIVERAMQKMRERDSQRPAKPRPSDPVFGTVVNTGTHRALRPEEIREDIVPATAQIVVIDQDALRAAGLLPPPHQERQIAEQYRQIKRPLIEHALNEGADATGSG